MNKIFFKSGQWFAYEAPEKPQAFGPSEEGVELMKQYKINLQQAKTNALPVLNPEIMNNMAFYNQGFRFKDEEMTWQGTMKKQKFPFLDGGWKDGYILSLPETTASGDAQQFNLPPAAVFNLQQIALADDDMVKVPGAAEKYRFIARHILELFAASGDTAKCPTCGNKNIEFCSSSFHLDTAKQGWKDFENLKLRVGFTVAHLNDHSKTVAGTLVRQDLKTAANLMLELYDSVVKNGRAKSGDVIEK
jgi:hypothetical protein